MRKGTGAWCLAVTILVGGFSPSAAQQQVPEGINIDRIDKAVELLSESRRAKLQGKTLISSKKFKEAQIILRKEFPAGKVIATTEDCTFIKRGNRQLRLSSFLTYKPLNKEMILTFNSTVDDNSGIAREDITADGIVERVEMGREEDPLFSKDHPGTSFEGKIKIIKYKNGITDTCSLKTNPNTDEAIILVHCRILGLKEFARGSNREAGSDQ